MQFNDIRLLVNKQKAFHFDGILLALDPGETTGIACFATNHSEGSTALVHASQIKTWPLEAGVENLWDLLNTLKPDSVVFESYQVYEWKSKDHVWSQIPTVQVIGMIKTLCIQKGIPYYQQTAQVAKGFCTDDKLTQWGFWQTGLRHARDAIRHACYFLLFGPSKT